MGFYGNITNTARTQFQFDKIYTSRVEMDQAASSDGIYAGRYVLVNYDNQYNLDYYLQAFKTIETISNEGEAQQVVYLGSSINNEELLRFRWVATEAEAQDADVVYEGQVVIVPADGYHNVANPTSTRTEWWFVHGQEEDTGYALFENYPDPSSASYVADVEAYGTARGYDSTVWQKTYQNGVDKYIMIAELNTIPPILDLEADAPKMVPLTPHFDASSTNVYYKLHWAPNWGLRIKAANPELRGPVLNQDGTSTPSAMTKMSSNTNQYRSDERVFWHNTTYNDRTGETNDYLFAVSKEDETEGLWLSPENVTASSLGAAAAIYYNKAGFKPEQISYAYDPVDSDYVASHYKPNIYYKKIGGKYYLADELHYHSDFDYYKKIEDHIGIEPTGRSGKMYNNHSGNLAASVQEDTQELSIMLPTIGDTIAAVWDLVYGDEVINEGLNRNMDVEWETARADLNRRGLRLVNDYNFDGYYTYQTKNVDTIAGAINSVHDLLGMIITSANHQELLSNINSLDVNRIYYDKDTHTFNRKKIVYNYTIIDNNDLDFYEYEPITIDQNTWTSGVYFIKDGTNYIIDNANSYTAGQRYVRKIKTVNPNNEYQEIDTTNMLPFDGTVYAYKDYVGADDEDYVFELVEITENTYETNHYYVKDNDTYVLDSEGTFNDRQIYYERMNRNHVRMSDYVRDPIYNKNKNYYRWNEILVQELPNLSGAYAKNTYYIKDGQGNYVFDQSDTPNTQTMYFSLEPNNLKTLAILGKHGIYVPGKYLYYDNTNGVYKIDNNPEMTDNRVYYLIDTGTGQQGINPNLYNKVTSYNRITLTINTYIPDVYYIATGDANEPYIIASDPFDPEETYYQKYETFEKIGETYYEIDSNTINQYAKNLIQFHQYEFFHKTEDNEFRVITRLSDINSLTDTNNIYVLRNSTHNEQGVSDGGTYILHTSDYSNPLVSAMVLQTQFYEPNRFHYLAEDFRSVELTSTNYIANKYYIYDNGEYTLATGSFDSTKVYYADYSDYILDTYPIKHNDRRYFTISSVGNRITQEFLDVYEYYVPTDNGEYTLITDNSELPTHIYERNSYYVYEDLSHTYTKGMPWSFDTRYIPASITLATRTQDFGLEPFEDFARNINTMHGMLLKIRNMLEYESEDTRDIRTVKGALNLLGDKIAQFATWSPGQMLLVDNYGRLHGAPVAGDNWVNININNNSLSPSVTLSHANPVIAGAVAVGPTSNQTPAFGAQFNIPAFSIDAKGHVASNGTTQVTIPNITLSVGTNTTTNSVLTDLTYSNGTFTKTSLAPISLVLTGYSGANQTGAIEASDTIQSAFNKLETRITDAQTDATAANDAIAAMSLTTVSAETGYVISSVEQNNGIVSATTKQLTAADIPDIKSKEFSYTPTGESADVTFTLQDLDERLRALEALQS